MTLRATLIGQHRRNLVDTPGHPDFIAEVERVLGVLDDAEVQPEDPRPLEAGSTIVIVVRDDRGVIREVPLRVE